VRMTLAEVIADLKKATIPNAQISDLNKVITLEQLRDKLTSTVMPSGKKIRMQPQAVDREDAQTALHFPHKYGADTRKVLAEVGYAQGDIEVLAKDGVIAA
jgi:crotonobetainyl-CoA:carnitine CoA-transferase CaiB-like acyl-CoA transferase